MRLYEYIIRRLILMVFVLLVVSVIVFYLTRGILACYFCPRALHHSEDERSHQTGTGCCPGSRYSFLSVLDSLRAGGTWMHSPALSAVFFVAAQCLFRELGIQSAARHWLGSNDLGVICVKVSRHRRARDRGFDSDRRNRASDGDNFCDSKQQIARSRFEDSCPNWVFDASLLACIHFTDCVLCCIFRVNNSGVLPSNGLLSTTCGICLSNVGTVRTYYRCAHF